MANSAGRCIGDLAYNRIGGFLRSWGFSRGSITIDLDHEFVDRIDHGVNPWLSRLLRLAGDQHKASSWSRERRFPVDVRIPHV